MDFQTKVELPTGSPLISHSERILLMGSCFAENIGSLLAENKFRVDMNPFGILYNPLSVSAALVEILKGKVYQEKDLFLYKECWHSPSWFIFRVISGGSSSKDKHSPVAGSPFCS